MIEGMPQPAMNLFRHDIRYKIQGKRMKQYKIVEPNISLQEWCFKDGEERKFGETFTVADLSVEAREKRLLYEDWLKTDWIKPVGPPARYVVSLPHYCNRLVPECFKDGEERKDGEFTYDELTARGQMYLSSWLANGYVQERPSLLTKIASIKHYKLGRIEIVTSEGHHLCLADMGCPMMEGDHISYKKDSVEVRTAIENWVHKRLEFNE